MSGPSGPKPTRCPKCRSSNVSENNKVNEHAAHHAVHAVHGIAGLVVAGALWLGAKAMNSATHDWKCGSCNHEFTRSAGACARCTGRTSDMYCLHCCGATLCETCIGERASIGSNTCDVCHKPVVRK